MQDPPQRRDEWLRNLGLKKRTRGFGTNPFDAWLATLMAAAFFAIAILGVVYTVIGTPAGRWQPALLFAFCLPLTHLLMSRASGNLQAEGGKLGYSRSIGRSSQVVSQRSIRYVSFVSMFRGGVAPVFAMKGGSVLRASHVQFRSATDVENFATSLGLRFKPPK